MREFTMIKCARPKLRPTHRASLRNRNARGHLTRGISMREFRANICKKCRGPDGTHWSALI